MFLIRSERSATERSREESRVSTGSRVQWSIAGDHRDRGVSKLTNFDSCVVVRLKLDLDFGGSHCENCLVERG